MNVAHLRLFRDLANERSISKAARANGISQSAASQHLQELERALQSQLVDRGVRPLQLTDAGRLYLALCDDVIRRNEEFDNALQALKGKVEGLVRLATIYSVGLSEVGRLEEEFAQRFPDADIRVSYLRLDKVYEAVLQNRADLGLVSYPTASADIDVIFWRQERMVVVAAPSSPLAQRVWLRPEDLDEQEFVGFDEDLPISEAINRYLEAADVSVTSAMRFDNVQMIKEAVALGSGISILPARLVRADVESGRLAAIRLDNPPLYRPLGVVHLRKKRFNQAAHAFLDLLREEESA